MHLSADQKKKVLLGGLGLGLFGAGIGIALLVQPRAPSVTAPPTPIPAVVDLAASSAASCDGLVSDPSDPGRYAAGVQDEQLAVGAVIEACGRAVQLNPGQARFEYQLARGLWAGGREFEAFSKFSRLANSGHAPSMKMMGDAYYSGRGLPQGEQADPPTALEWYKAADAAGIVSARAAVETVEMDVKKHQFNKEWFKSGDYMEMIYNGDYSKLNFPLGIIYYMQGISAGIDDANIVFIDSTCGPMSNAVGKKALQVAESAVKVGSWLNFDKDGNWDPRYVAANATSEMSKSVILDEGKRDAVILFDKDNYYGCQNPITQQIMNNIMLSIRS